MMKSVYEKVELVANIAIIVVTILLGTILVRAYLLPNSAPTSQQTSSTRGAGVGQSVNMKDVNWQQNGKTLLLVLSSTCHFCTESAPFYQKLVSESAVRLIAALPQDVDEGKAYLDKLSVPINDVRQVSIKVNQNYGDAYLTIG